MAIKPKEKASPKAAALMNTRDEEMGDLSEASSHLSAGTGTGEGTTTQGNNQDASGSESQIKIGQSESKYVFRARAVLVVVLFVVAFVICGGVFWYTRDQEKALFRSTYNELATKVAETFKSSAGRRLSAIESLAVDITSNAISRQQTWPNVTVDDFEKRVSYTLSLGEVVGLIFMPFVTGEDKEGWEAYSAQNQGWFTEGLESQERFADLMDAELDQDSVDIITKTWPGHANMSIHEKIFGISGTGRVEETGDGPYAPWWQFAPVFPVPGLVNYNALSHPSRAPIIKELIEEKTKMVSEAFDYADVNAPGTMGKKAALNLFLNRRQDIVLDYQDGPVSDLYVPIFEEVSFGAVNPSRVVGTLTAYVYWQAYFVNILPSGTPEMTVILENTCGQQFTYSVTGDTVKYLGQGELHNGKYDDMAVSTGWNAFLAGSEKNVTAMRFNEDEPHCSYQVRIFPTQDLESKYVTSEPLLFMFVLVAAFIVTSFVFVVYDYGVERRNLIVMKQAVESTEVVNKLYPAAVRDRMFKEDKKSIASSKTSSYTFPLAHSDTPLSEESGNHAYDGIIADLYEDATVMFGDLAGFTNWSAKREPKDVFLLLETLYGAFDKIAKRRKVFKIETIGDCYLAVCGVPNPNPAHAVVMTRFASECVTAMELVIREKLADTLGEDTKELILRVGLHSGAITAGVLRGERARFQLFGDTVNTASRMESNGVPGKIQVSESTAKCLIASGKDTWLTEREGGIEAKGKGKLRTYFAQPKPGRNSHSGSSTMSSCSGDTGPSYRPAPCDCGPAPDDACHGACEHPEHDDLHMAILGEDMEFTAIVEV